ncbi:MAG: hypothetical protein AAF805_13140, partial [Planctomycetota bacterium]
MPNAGPPQTASIVLQEAAGMETRRNESAPLWLVAFAALALVGSVLATRRWTPAEDDARLDAPPRTTAPLRFALDSLEPIASPASVAAPTGPLTVADPLLRAPRLKPFAPVVVEDPLAWCLEDLPRATAPLPGERSSSLGQLVVLVPAEPRWFAGLRRPMVVSASARERWSIGGFDTLAAARVVGGKLADPLGAVAEWLPTRPTQRVATRRGPRLTAATPASTATVARQGSNRSATPSIADYVAAGYAHSAAAAPLALAEQLDRVAESRDAAPWAWAVAYRLR